MPRPIKNGLDYFPLDTVMDTKIELIEAEFRLTGFAIVVKLFQKIYGEQGYYCEWTDEVALLFASKNGVGSNAVSEIVQASVRRGIFDKDLFDKYSILTSAGIQKRYFEAVNRRTQINVISEYLLVSDTILSENVNKNRVNVCNNSINVYKNSQRKVKESKLNKNKESIGTASRFTPPTIEEVKEYCKKRNNNVDAQRFIDYYTSNGWFVGKTKMKDWKAAVRTWESNGYSNRDTSNLPNKNNFQNYDNDVTDFDVELIRRRMEEYHE